MSSPSGSPENPASGASKPDEDKTEVSPPRRGTPVSAPDSRPAAQEVKNFQQFDDSDSSGGDSEDGAAEDRRRVTFAAASFAVANDSFAVPETSSGTGKEGSDRPPPIDAATGTAPTKPVAKSTVPATSSGAPAQPTQSSTAPGEQEPGIEPYEFCEAVPGERLFSHLLLRTPTAEQHERTLERRRLNKAALAEPVTFDCRRHWLRILVDDLPVAFDAELKAVQRRYESFASSFHRGSLERKARLRYDAHPAFQWSERQDHDVDKVGATCPEAFAEAARACFPSVVSFHRELQGPTRSTAAGLASQGSFSKFGRAGSFTLRRSSSTTGMTRQGSGKKQQQRRRSSGSGWDMVGPGSYVTAQHGALFAHVWSSADLGQRVGESLNVTYLRLGAVQSKVRAVALPPCITLVETDQGQKDADAVEPAVVTFFAAIPVRSTTETNGDGGAVLREAVPLADLSVSPEGGNARVAGVIELLAAFGLPHVRTAAPPTQQSESSAAGKAAPSQGDDDDMLLHRRSAVPPPRLMVGLNCKIYLADLPFMLQALRAWRELCASTRAERFPGVTWRPATAAIAAARSQPSVPQLTTQWPTAQAREVTASIRDAVRDTVQARLAEHDATKGSAPQQIAGDAATELVRTGVLRRAMRRHALPMRHMLAVAVAFAEGMGDEHAAELRQQAEKAEADRRRRVVPAVKAAASKNSWLMRSSSSATFAKEEQQPSGATDRDAAAQASTTQKGGYSDAALFALQVEAVRLAVAAEVASRTVKWFFRAEFDLARSLEAAAWRRNNDSSGDQDAQAWALRLASLHSEILNRLLYENTAANYEAWPLQTCTAAVLKFWPPASHLRGSWTTSTASPTADVSTAAAAGETSENAAATVRQRETLCQTVFGKQLHDDSSASVDAAPQEGFPAMLAWLLRTPAKVDVPTPPPPPTARLSTVGALIEVVGSSMGSWLARAVVTAASIQHGRLRFASHSLSLGLISRVQFNSNSDGTGRFEVRPSLSATVEVGGTSTRSDNRTAQEKAGGGSVAAAVGLPVDYIRDDQRTAVPLRTVTPASHWSLLQSHAFPPSAGGKSGAVTVDNNTLLSLVAAIPTPAGSANNASSSKQDEGQRTVSDTATARLESQQLACLCLGVMFRLLRCEDRSDMVLERPPALSPPPPPRDGGGACGTSPQPQPQQPLSLSEQCERLAGAVGTDNGIAYWLRLAIVFPTGSAIATAAVTRVAQSLVADGSPTGDGGGPRQLHGFGDLVVHLMACRAVAGRTMDELERARLLASAIDCVSQEAAPEVFRALQPTNGHFAEAAGSASSAFKALTQSATALGQALSVGGTRRAATVLITALKRQLLTALQAAVHAADTTLDFSRGTAKGHRRSGQGEWHDGLMLPLLRAVTGSAVAAIAALEQHTTRGRDAEATSQQQQQHHHGVDATLSESAIDRLVELVQCLCRDAVPEESMALVEARFGAGDPQNAVALAHYTVLSLFALRRDPVVTVEHRGVIAALAAEAVRGSTSLTVAHMHAMVASGAFASALAGAGHVMLEVGLFDKQDTVMHTAAQLMAAHDSKHVSDDAGGGSRVAKQADKKASKPTSTDAAKAPGAADVPDGTKPSAGPSSSPPREPASQVDALRLMASRSEAIAGVMRGRLAAESGAGTIQAVIRRSFRPPAKVAQRLLVQHHAYVSGLLSLNPNAAVKIALVCLVAEEPLRRAPIVASGLTLTTPGGTLEQLRDALLADMRLHQRRQVYVELYGQQLVREAIERDLDALVERETSARRVLTEAGMQIWKTLRGEYIAGRLLVRNLNYYQGVDDRARRRKLRLRHAIEEAVQRQGRPPAFLRQNEAESAATGGDDAARVARQSSPPARGQSPPRRR